MKKFFLMICLCFCEFCYSQEVQRIYLKIDKDILYDKSTLDNTLKEFITIDSQTSFSVYEENDVEKYGTYDTQLRLRQYYGEYWLFQREVLVLIKDNKIVTISGSYYSSIGTIEKTTPLTESEILQIAEKEVFASKTDYDFQYEIEKVISKNYFDEDDKNLYYAYKIAVTDKNDINIGEEIIIDENSGKILRKSSLIRHDGPSAIDLPKQQIAISSNPVKDLLQLTLPTTNNEIKIFDMQGKKVLQTECGETANINVSMLPKGVYTIIVNNSESQRFVKE